MSYIVFEKHPVYGDSRTFTAELVWTMLTIKGYIRKVSMPGKLPYVKVLQETPKGVKRFFRPNAASVLKRCVTVSNTPHC